MNQYPELFREKVWKALFRDKANSTVKIFLLLFFLGIILYDGGWRYLFCALGILLCLAMNFILLIDGYIFFKKMRSPSMVDGLIFLVIAIVNIIVFVNIWPLWLLYILIWVIPWIPYVIIRFFGK